MDKFHSEPVEWLDLFDYLEYMDIEGKIADYVRVIRKEQ